MPNNLSIQICSVVYSDIRNNRYTVSKLNDTVGITFDVIPLGAKDTPDSGVIIAPTYEVGELVICILPAVAHQSDTTVLWTGLILCSAPSGMTGAAIPSANAYEEASTTGYLDVLKDTKAPAQAALIRSYDASTAVPGDIHINGDSTVLHVTDDIITIAAGYSEMSMNSADSSLRSKAIVRSSESLCTVDREYIINGYPIKVSKPYYTDMPGTISIQGKLIGGRITATRKDSSTLTAQQYVSDTGNMLTQTTKGIAFEQLDVLNNLYVPEYSAALATDDKVTDTDIELSALFDNVKNSDNWEAVGISKKATYKAGFGLLPSGGFIVRDKWGSEIRMENGDIQITAAKNIIVANGGDISMISRGVLSVLAEKGVDTLTHGKMTCCSGDAGMYIATTGRMEGRAKTINASASNNIQLHSEDSEIRLEPTRISLRSTDINSMASGDSVVVGEKRVLLASTDALIDINKNKIHQAGDTTKIHGDLVVAGGKYIAGELGRQKLQAGKGGMCTLIVSGDILSTGQIRCDSDLVTRSQVVGNSVLAKQRDPELGVYSLSSKPPVKLAHDIGIITAITTDSPQLTKISLEPENTGESLYPFTESEDNTEFTIVQPLYPTVTGPVNPKITVDNETKERYIYPGERFWKGSNIACVNNTDKTLLEESISDKREKTDSLKL